MSGVRRDPMRWMDGGDGAPAGFADTVRAEQHEAADAAQLARVLDKVAQQLARPDLAQAYREQAVQGEALQLAVKAGARNAWRIPLGAGVVCAIAITWASFAMRAAPATPVATQRPRPLAAASPAATPPRAVEGTATAPTAPIAPTAPTVAAATPPSRARDHRVATDRMQAPDPQAELALLEAAQRALATDPRQTLALSETHRRRFARPQFDQEREMLAIEAQLQLGGAAQARARARRFERSHPTSSHLPRLRALLAGAGAAP